MQIKLYPNETNRLAVEPAKKMRDWMNDNVHSYRCVPLSVANQIGWDIILDRKVVIAWNGNNSREDIMVIEGQESAKSHFGSGTITLDIGYTWHTPENTQLLIMPVPNDDNYNRFQSLTALVETDRLKYPWFLTIRMVNKGYTTIEAGTKLCRVIPITIGNYEDISIKIENEPQDFIDYRAWQARERANRPETQPWQKFYHQVAAHTSITMKKVENDDRSS